MEMGKLKKSRPELKTARSATLKELTEIWFFPRI